MTATAERTTLKAFIVRHKITATAEWANTNPNMVDMPPGSSHWLVTLRCGRRRITIPFSQGPAICQEPDANDVLNCLASDAASFENAQSFEDWCSEYGYDVDSRKAEKTYHAVESQTEKLKRFLPTEAYEQLLWHTDLE